MTDKGSSRRQFLQGHALLGKVRAMAGEGIDAASDALPPMDEDDASLTGAVASSPTGWPLLRFVRSAMASDFEVAFNRGQYPQATEAALAALDEVERLESLLSAFRSESEISRINRDAAGDAVVALPEVWNLLVQCQQLARETDGAIDVSASTLWRLWGFAKRRGKLPSHDEIADALQNVGASFVQLEEASQSVRFAKPGVEISFGCIGKGAALDLAQCKLREWDVEHALFHGGRSSILAVGGRWKETWLHAAQSNFPAGVHGTLLEPTRDRSVGWTIGISHPIRQGSRLAEVRLTDEALGTSGSQHQFFIHQGRRYSHIIDPRSGWPAQGVLMAVVIAPTAAWADALSTAFFVLTPEQTAEYCRRHPGIAALLVLPNDRDSGEAETGLCRIMHFGFEQNQIRFFLP